MFSDYPWYDFILSPWWFVDLLYILFLYCNIYSVSKVEFIETVDCTFDIMYHPTTRNYGDNAI